MTGVTNVKSVGRGSLSPGFVVFDGNWPVGRRDDAVKLLRVRSCWQPLYSNLRIDDQRDEIRHFG